MFRFSLTVPVLLAAAAVAPAHAQVGTIVGFDIGATAVGTRSAAAQASFRQVTGGSVMLDFEQALPTGVTIQGGQLTSNATCEGEFCGFNTTLGGQSFLLSPGYKSSVTFTFNEGITFFGAYFSGLQLETGTITFNDGSKQRIALPYDSVLTGGMAFVGFYNTAQAIQSVTIYTGNDIVAIDDVIYGRSAVPAVPEAGTLSMMALGLGLVAAAARRRKA